MPRRDQLFETITTEGALLPSDFLQRLAQRDRNIAGLTADASPCFGGPGLPLRRCQPLQSGRPAQTRRRQRILSLMEEAAVSACRRFSASHHRAASGKLLMQAVVP